MTRGITTEPLLWEERTKAGREVKTYEYDVFGGSQEDGYGMRRKWLGRGEVEGARGLG